ncbi:MAG: dihydrofolate reductase family protein [Nitrosarchaeum sp.]
MKVIMYMAISANGHIEDSNKNTPWSNEEWIGFSNMVKDVGNLVVGKNTYNIMIKEKEFDKIGNPYTIIISNTNSLNFIKSPEEAIEKLKEKGFSKILVAGGSSLNSSFLEKGLVDEIYLDVEPYIFGDGLNLISKSNINLKLELLEINKLSKNTIQLHYKILK